MAFGMRAKYAVHVIGNSHANELWLVEGFATGLSVAEALRLLRIPAAVVVCFSDGNLVAVANRMRGNRFVLQTTIRAEREKRRRARPGCRMQWRIVRQNQEHGRE